MPRLARAVFASVPHHITQRGNRRENVFFADEDYHAYLDWLQYYSQKHHLEILAYCLMSNHIHLVAVPNTENTLHEVLKPLHMRYAQRINRKNKWQGHLWQGRYFSAPMDEQYMWAAIRYVERNPVRARIVTRAEDYSWSSAAGHCMKNDDSILSKKTKWKKLAESVSEWSAWLAEGDDSCDLMILRRNIEKGLPCGTDLFIRKLENLIGRSLQFRPQGRPKTNDTKG